MNCPCNMAGQPDRAISLGLIRRNVGWEPSACGHRAEAGRVCARSRPDPKYLSGTLGLTGGRRIARWFRMRDRRRLPGAIRRSRGPVMSRYREITATEMDP